MTRPDALVIGGDGLVGSHLVKALAGRTIVVTRRAPSVPGSFLDLSDAASVGAVVREANARTVILAAAMAHVERCEEDPSASALVNVVATQAAAAAAREVGSRLVVFSSEYVFPGGGGRHAEDDPVGPINEYGRQKVALERVAAGVPDHLIVRTSGVFGWERACKNFVCSLVTRLRRGERAIVPDDQVITPTYAPDLARAVLDLVDRDTNGIVHVAGPDTVRRLWFGLTVARIFGLPEDLVEGRSTAAIGYRAPRPLNVGLSDSRLRTLLGHGLRTAEEALREMRTVERPA